MQKRQNNRAENRSRKNATKTTTQFTFIKPLQVSKKHRENCKRQEKCSWTKNALGTNHKGPQGPQKDKTVPRGRPTCSQASCQQVNNFFSVSIFKKKWINHNLKKKIRKFLLVEKIGTIVLVPLHWTLKNTWTNEGLENYVAWRPQSAWAVRSLLDT